MLLLEYLTARLGMHGSFCWRQLAAASTFLRNLHLNQTRL